MADQDSALRFLRRQIEDLVYIKQQAEKALNAIYAKEQFHKWKRQVLDAIRKHVGPEYAESLTKDWLEGTFAGADMYEELEDDVDMCTRQLKKLVKNIEENGLVSDS